MEGQGDSSGTAVGGKSAAGVMDERGDASTHASDVQEETVTSTEMLSSDKKQTSDSVLTSGMKDSVVSDELIDSTQDDKEGSSDSQSEPFEMVKIPENGNNSDDGQRETTEQSGEPNSSEVKEKDPFMDILGNGLLKKKVIKEGGGRATRPNHGELVTLRVEGRLDDDTVVDKHDSITFSLGDGDVIQAWDLAVSLMELGEECELITAPKYAYGQMGSDTGVPANSRITYTIELTSKEESPGLNTLTVQQRIVKGEGKRERGNYLFARKDYTGAINSYTKGLSVLQYPGSSSGADQAVLQELLDATLKCSNNLAACQLKIEAYDAAIRSCESVLKSQTDNVKALFRIGKAYGEKGDGDEALTYLRKALKIDPSSKIIHAEMAKISKKMRKETDSERELYRRMMGGANVTPSKKPTTSPWWKLPLMFGGVLTGVVSIGLAVAYRYGQH